LNDDHAIGDITNLFDGTAAIIGAPVFAASSFAGASFVFCVIADSERRAGLQR
jgi:hypothetical protein